MIELPNLMTPKELMDYLKCSKSRAYELCRKRDFPSFKVGKNFYIRADKLPEWMDSESKKDKI